jgi:hypothetical protein
MKVWKKNHGRVYTRKEEEGESEKKMGSGYHRRIAMSASDAGQLAYDRAVFRRVVKGEKFRQGHATE